jgi:hypothetical protein
LNRIKNEVVAVGLLDDLKREADLAREAKEAEEARQAGLERVYRVELVPRLLEIYRYLSEMIGHLEAADWVVEAAYDIPGLGRVERFRQGDYRLFIDSHDLPKRVAAQFACAVPDERKFSLPTAKAEELRQFLTANKVVYSEWPLRDARGQISGNGFQCKLRVRAAMVFEADIETSRIRVVTHNFERLADREYFFGYAAVGADWLDDLGHFLLRKKDVLGGRALSEEERERLRRLAADEEKARQPADAEPAPVDDGKSRQPGLFGALRGRLFKSDNK